ncbi:MAG TPA: FAD-dependent oxidoreductase [Acidimicrobiales bacterium]|nr:FAD-dependent oxidoreductase [Acidimicrobiales bacterium]
MPELPAAASPTLDDRALAELAPFGQERPVEVGDILFRAGDESSEFLVILEGAVDIIRPDGAGETLITTHVAGRFLGELNLLTGQRLYLTARVSEPGRVVAIPLDDFRRLMSSRPDLADTIFSAFVARREILRSGEGARAIRIIGSRYSPEAMALRAFAARSRLPHTWIDIEAANDVEALLQGMGFERSDTPVVVTPMAVLRHPSPGEFAEHLGLTFRRVPGYTFDLVVVGSGPAGLSSAVYGASEGLHTVSLDALSAGGQASASTRIENYVGFPNGISGEELTSRAAIQAQRLGARLNAPCEVAGLRVEEGFHVVVLADGSEVPARTVIVASGARYQRLAVDDLERFEGAGVYYAATDLEVRICSGSPVIVVGGGNSAGQAAIYLAQHGSRVSIVIRGGDLAHSMSHYLIERIEADERIEVFINTEVCALAGEGHLGHVTLEHTPTSERQTLQCSGLFCFIGAEPATAWLDGVLELDPGGFILTDNSLPPSVISGDRFATRPPLPFETSVPGVFAVGDVRSGSLKRVAAAVGEGSSAVRSVHEHLATIAH